MINVNKIDDNIIPKNVFVSCTDKSGLVSNKNNQGNIITGLPENGLLGKLAELFPDIRFISTGGTYKIIAEKGLNVIQVSEYTGYPEMKTGLVKSLHPAVHAGIIGHKYTVSDKEFMEKHNISNIDIVIVNFYALDKAVAGSSITDDFESIRQAIDVGGPTMAHNARKSFISTALITKPESYSEIIEEIKKEKAVNLSLRLKLAKEASSHITEYMDSVDKVFNELTLDDVTNAYEIE